MGNGGGFSTFGGLSSQAGQGFRPLLHPIQTPHIPPAHLGHLKSHLSHGTRPHSGFSHPEICQCGGRRATMTRRKAAMAASSQMAARGQYLRIWALAAGEGTPTSSSLSNRPGRLRAESSASGLLVAAITTTPAPPISYTLTTWLNLTRLLTMRPDISAAGSGATPPPPPPSLSAVPLAGASASSSSMKMTEGASACLASPWGTPQQYPSRGAHVVACKEARADFALGKYKEPGSRCCMSRDSSMCVCLELFCFNARNAQLDAGEVALHVLRHIIKLWQRDVVWC
ncbi:MAG: hypothetical protein FRX49_11830 [Trebouxia sp. A1-2]|nr:MAG: hypothetical protein FRX49_11830 [Trebouxia sp. A1-2]